MSTSAVRRIQSGTACSEAGAISRVEHHRTSKLAHRLSQPVVAQNTIKIETLPELRADVNWSRFTMLLGGDPRWIDSDQSGFPPANGGRRDSGVIAPHD
jgi:hypothetical protein